MELIVDLMLPTQGHFSICNQVDDQYKEHSCLIAFMLLMHPFLTWYQSHTMDGTHKKNIHKAQQKKMKIDLGTDHKRSTAQTDLKHRPKKRKRRPRQT